MSSLASPGWQLVLADLSLILFLTTASALPDTNERDGANSAALASGANNSDAPASVFVAGIDADFTGWLTAQPRDPREQLTIRVDYTSATQAGTIERVRGLAREASGAGFAPRIILEPAPAGNLAPSSITASFAFDAGPAGAGDVARALQDTGDNDPASGE